MTDQGRTDWGTAHVLAAAGDHDAQLDLAHFMLKAGIEGDIPYDQAVTISLMWGQMAVTSCRARHLSGFAGLLLAQVSQSSDEDVHAGKHEDEFAWALAITDALADVGHGGAEFASYVIASRVPASVIAKAKTLKPLITVAPLNEDEKREQNDRIEELVENLRVLEAGV